MYLFGDKVNMSRFVGAKKTEGTGNDTPSAEHTCSMLLIRMLNMNKFSLP